MNSKSPISPINIPLIGHKSRGRKLSTLIMQRQTSVLQEGSNILSDKAFSPTQAEMRREHEEGANTDKERQTLPLQNEQRRRSSQQRRTSSSCLKRLSLPHQDGLQGGQFYLVEKEFDPFKSPPDISLAEKHSKARLVGEASEEQKIDKENYCPCCYSIIEKKQIPISCEESKLAFLGVGISQMFLLNKYFGLLVVVIFVFGGSLQLMVTNQLNCGEHCLTIMGVAVLADKNVDIELMNPLLQTLVAMVILAAVLQLKKKLAKKINRFNEGQVSPSEYTLLVQNLPANVRKDELKRHFEKLTNRSIVAISMAFDTEKYFSCIEQKYIDIKTFNTTKYSILKLEESLLHTPPEKQAKITKKIETLKAENAMLAEEMNHSDELIQRFEDDCEAEKDPSKFLGTAFITFSDTVPINTIVEEWGYTYTNIFKFLLLRWVPPPFIDYKSKLLILRKAPAPADVIWENLRYSLPRNVVNNTLMLLLSCVILYISFHIQFQVMEYVYPLKKESYEEHSFILMIRGGLLSICVVIVNLSLRNTVFFFTKLQRFDHHTKMLNAYINKYITLYVFNSAFMPYLVHVYLDVGNVDIELLVWDIHFIVLATSISTPLSKLFDPVMFLKMFKRWHIRSYPPENCPYTQKEANYWFEGHPIEIADSYAYMARVLFLGAWYAQVAPLGLLFSLFGLVCNHYIDKYSLLRIHSTPEQITEEVYSKVIFSLDLLPFIYLCGGIEYHQKSIISTNVFALIFKFINEGIAVVGLFLSLLAFIFHHRRKLTLKSANKENRLYSDVRILFSTEYDRCNPVTQLKASNDFIQFLYDQQALPPSSKLNSLKNMNKSPLLSSTLKSKRNNIDKDGLPSNPKQKSLQLSKSLLSLSNHINRSNKKHIASSLHDCSRSSSSSSSADDERQELHQQDSSQTPYNEDNSSKDQRFNQITEKSRQNRPCMLELQDMKKTNSATVNQTDQ